MSLNYPAPWEYQNVEYIVLVEPANGVEWWYYRQPAGEQYQLRGNGYIGMRSASAVLTNLFDWIKNKKPYRVGMKRDVPDITARPPKCGSVNDTLADRTQVCTRQASHEGWLHAQQVEGSRDLYLAWKQAGESPVLITLGDLLDDRIPAAA